MATSLFSSPANPHFFQPLRPGFKTHLSIPVAFYSKYIEGKEEGNTVTLISDASEITWKLKLDGRRLTNGWEKFAVAHSLKVGDILVFRHEGNLMFYVTPLGPSCCEILYSHDDVDHTEKVTGNSKVKKKNPIKDETDSYVVPVTPSNLRADSLTLPKGFTNSSGLSTLCNEIILIDEKSRSSTLDFVYHRSSGRFCVRRGWRAFCCTNGHKTGGFMRFKLVSNGKTPVLRFFPLERDEDNTGDPESAEEKKNVGSHESVMKEKENVRSLESTEEKKNVGSHVSAKEKKNVESLSLSDDSCFVLPVTVTNLREDRLYLPRRLSRSIENEGLHEIGLVNKEGTKWTLSLRNNKSSGQFCIKDGWRNFCEANGRKVGCSFSFKMVRLRKNLVLLMNETLKGKGV